MRAGEPQADILGNSRITRIGEGALIRSVEKPRQFLLRVFIGASHSGVSLLALAAHAWDIEFELPATFSASSDVASHFADSPRSRAIASKDNQIAAAATKPASYVLSAKPKLLTVSASSSKMISAPA
jgi:hypothetical protein